MNEHCKGMDEQTSVQCTPLSGVDVIGNRVLGRPVQLLYMIHSKRDKCIKFVGKLYSFLLNFTYLHE